MSATRTAPAASSAASRQWQLGQPVWNLTLNTRGDWGVGALGNGLLVVLPSDDAGEDPRVMEAHNGVSLEICADADDHAFLSGGDDGQLLLVDPQLAVPTLLAKQPQGRWIDHVAASADGLRAYASGKTLFRLNEEGQEQVPPFALPSSIGGLSFSPNGKRLAVAHYGGVSLLWTQAPETPPDLLPWKGSHLALLWSPEGDFLLSSMQDGAVHGWQLEGGKPLAEKGREMHMQGYQTKIASMRFTSGKKPYLATSGAAQAVCWPFHDGGPWEKQPLMLGGEEGRLVSHVAPHPRDPMVAAGYDDGMIILAPLDGRMEIMIHPPAGKGAAVTGMVWDKEGQTMIVSLENGTLLLFTLASISRFVRGRFSG